MFYKILSGNLPDQDSVLFSRSSGEYSLKKGRKDYKIEENLSAIERISDQKKGGLMKKAGFGLAGGALLGPLGMIIGVLCGRSKTEIVCALEVRPKWKFVAVLDPEGYIGLQEIAKKNAAAARALKDSEPAQPALASTSKKRKKKPSSGDDVHQGKNSIEGETVAEEEVPAAKSADKPKENATQENAPSEFGDLLSASAPSKPTRKRKWWLWALCFFLFLALCDIVIPDKYKNKQEGTSESAKQEQTAPKQINKELKESVGKGIKKYFAVSELPDGTHYSYAFSELDDDNCDMFIKFDEHLVMSDFEGLAYAGMAGIISGYEENNKSTKSISVKLDIYLGEKHIGILRYPSAAGAADWELMK